MEADHLAGIEQAAGIVLLFREQLNVVGAEAAGVLKIIHMRVGYKHSDCPAVVDHVVQALCGGEAHDGDGAGDDDTFAVLHELDEEQDLVAVARAQEPELLFAFRR